jgi:hypothetical protein
MRFLEIDGKRYAWKDILQKAPGATQAIPRAAAGSL